MTRPSPLSFPWRAVLLAFLVITNIFSQGTMHRGSVESEDRDSNGNLKTQSDSKSRIVRVHGIVTIVEANPPEQLVELIADCPSTRRLMAVADSKGKFNFTFNPTLQSDAYLTKGCTLYATLEGYRSDRINLATLNNKGGSNLGTINLQPISADPSGLSSLTDSNATPALRKHYQKGLDQAAKMDWKGAILTLQDASSANPDYATAWLTLGICQQNLGNLSEAEKSFLQSARVDPKFALPLINAAAIESAVGNMTAAFSNSQQAINLNPRAFPNAYSFNAIASLSTKNAPAAEASARSGIALDDAHQYPELEYALGVVLYAKGDFTEASAHLQKYLEHSPNGPNVSAARSQIVQMRNANAAARQLAVAAHTQQAGPTTAALTNASAPTAASLREHNAALLTNPSPYTCLESVWPAKVDQRGRASELESSRVDVALSNGKEIYGVADGKHFSDSAAHDLLGYSFATTGLFSSIARSLIAADQFAIEPAGEVMVQGETLIRYNFRSLPSTAGWTIAYGKDSGVASEQGWFLVESKSQVLRRVLVSAVNIPSHLKLVSLIALIDYEPETVAGRRALFPTIARMQVGERSGMKHMSLLSFNHCRAFAAESTLSFDDPPAAKEVNKSSRPKRLPPNTEILVSLQSPITLAAAQKNDVITATVSQAVIENGHEWIKVGAAIEGHVRLNPGTTSLTLELDRVATSSGWLPFHAQLLKLGSSQAEVKPPSESHLELITADNQAELIVPDVPGVATIEFSAKDTLLPSGTEMIWKTEPLEVEKKDATSPQLGTFMRTH